MLTGWAVISWPHNLCTHVMNESHFCDGYQQHFNIGTSSTGSQCLTHKAIKLTERTWLARTCKAVSSILNGNLLSRYGMTSTVSQILTLWLAPDGDIRGVFCYFFSASFSALLNSITYYIEPLNNGSGLYINITTIKIGISGRLMYLVRCNCW